MCKNDKGQRTRVTANYCSLCCSSVWLKLAAVTCFLAYLALQIVAQLADQSNWKRGLEYWISVEDSDSRDLEGHEAEEKLY